MRQPTARFLLIFAASAAEILLAWCVTSAEQRHPQPPEVDKGGELLLNPEHQQTSTSASSADGTTPSTQMKLIPMSPSQDSDSESLHVELVVMDSRDPSQSQPQQGDRRSESLSHRQCSSPTQESDSESMCLECQPATPDSPGGAMELSVSVETGLCSFVNIMSF